MTDRTAPTKGGRRPLATPQELADYLGGSITVQTLYQWRRRRIGPKAVRVGRHLRYRWEDIDAWLQENQAKAS